MPIQRVISPTRIELIITTIIATTKASPSRRST